jgi:short-subunit dehydrogenase
MKIFCTGNPARKTIAYTLGADVNASLSTGWDFTDTDTIARFKESIQQHNVFVNSAYIAPGIQEVLMNECHAEWTRTNIRGHIINIGTTLENTNDSSHYTQSKRNLKHRSLQLSDETGIYGVKTTYMILGGLGPDGCSTENVVQTILWILNQPYRIPLIQIESIK